MMKSLYRLLVVLILVSMAFSAGVTPAKSAVVNCADTTTTGIPQAECEALVALFNSTGGDAWTNKTNWLTDSAISSWYGVVVSSGHVTELQLYTNNLTGSLPAALGNLTELYYFHFAENHLTGSIPSELASLQKMLYFYLSDNQLTGTIPSFLFSYPLVRDIRLNTNQITGPIPAELVNATSLRKLILYDNRLTGKLPTDIGNLTSLSQLWINYNDLYGPIPASLTSMSNLTSLIISGNGLWSNDPALTAFIESKSSDWESSEASQGLIPAMGDHVGWGDLGETAGTAAFSFSKYYRTMGGTTTPAAAYLIEMKAVSGTEFILEKAVENSALDCGTAAATEASICSYHPVLSDFSEALAPGEYYWKISVAFEKDTENNWMWINVDTPPKTFTFSGTPLLEYPTGTTTKTTPTFKWSGVNNAEAYNFVILNSNGSEKFNTILPVSACTAMDCVYVPTMVSLAASVYTWKVRADMGGGDYTGWGDESFVEAAPPAPKFPAVSATTPNPKIIWSPVAGQTRYQVQLFTSTGAKKLDKTFDTSVCNATSCSYTPSPALTLGNGAYKWKVRAGDDVEWGTYSAVKTFNKVTPPAPITPAGSITVTNPKFTWRRIPGATKYYIVLQKSSGALVKNMEVKTLSCTATTCSYTPSPALNLVNGQYKWKVRAYNGYYGPYGAYMSFTKK